MKSIIEVVQFEIKQFCPDYNLQRSEEYIEKSNADIIEFPELFLTGPLAGKIEFADNGRYKNYFRDFAKKHCIDIVAGSIIEQEYGKLYNTTYYIDSNGEIKSEYRKINLWHPERSFITAGKNISVFDTNYGKIGLSNCWDLAFPEIFREIVKKEAEIIFCPSYWCYGDAGIGIKYDKNSEIKFVDSLCTARAFENEIIFVYCNAAGELNLNEYKDTLIGYSQITMPFKGAVKKLEHNKEETFAVQIDTDILKDT